MTVFVLRRTSQLLMALAIVAVGVLVAIESADGVDAGWRTPLADLTDSVLAPDHPRWALSLAGAGMGLVAILLFGAQFAPRPKGRSRMLNVSSNDDGDTTIRGRAALSAVRHELGGIDGVTRVDATMPRPKHVVTVVRVDDRANVADIEHQARQRLDTPFWIDLGLPDLAVDIRIEFDPASPRVQ